MASSTFVFVSSDSGAGVVLFTCPVLLLSYHPYVTDRVVFTFRLTILSFLKSHQNQWDFEAFFLNPINSATCYQESAQNQNPIQSIKIHRLKTMH